LGAFKEPADHLPVVPTSLSQITQRVKQRSRLGKPAFPAQPIFGNIEYSDLQKRRLTVLRHVAMFLFRSASQQGRIAIVTNAGRNAMAATASGARSIAGRLPWNFGSLGVREQ